MSDAATESARAEGIRLALRELGYIEGQAIKTIPIVMVGAGIDPIEAGFVESLAHPGGNITGITTLNRELRWEAAGAAQRSRSQSCPRRGSLRCGTIGVVHDVKEVLPVAARALNLTLQP